MIVFPSVLIATKLRVAAFCMGCVSTVGGQPAGRCPGAGQPNYFRFVPLRRAPLLNVAVRWEGIIIC